MSIIEALNDKGFHGCYVQSISHINLVLRHFFESISFKFCFCECNGVAHRLARLGGY